MDGTIYNDNYPDAFIGAPMWDILANPKNNVRFCVQMINIKI